MLSCRIAEKLRLLKLNHTITTTLVFLCVDVFADLVEQLKCSGFKAQSYYNHVTCILYVDVLAATTTPRPTTTTTRPPTTTPKWNDPGPIFVPGPGSGFVTHAPWPTFTPRPTPRPTARPPSPIWPTLAPTWPTAAPTYRPPPTPRPTYRPRPPATLRPPYYRPPQQQQYPNWLLMLLLASQVEAP